MFEIALGFAVVVLVVAGFLKLATKWWFWALLIALILVTVHR